MHHRTSHLAASFVGRGSQRASLIQAVCDNQGLPARAQATALTVLVGELKDFLGVERPRYVSLSRDVLLDTGIRVTKAAEATVGDFIEVEGKHYIALRVKGRKRRGEEKR